MNDNGKLSNEPPGTFREIIAHPAGYDRVIEKAIIMEHRFAFIFWMKWHYLLQRKKWLKQSAPTLITIDWHRDLSPPSQVQKLALKNLTPENLSDISNYVWAQFDQTNDGHILSAAWLNVVGDIIVLKNSAGELHDTFQDKEGNEHHIHEFREYRNFKTFLLKRNDSNIFLDIDLDYFIHGKGNMIYPDAFKPYSEDEIKQIIDPHNPVFKNILSKVDGFTVAQEPAYCGGIVNSCKILEVVNAQFFDERNNWRHLSNEL